MSEIAVIPVEHILGLPWFIWGFVAMGVVLFAILCMFILYWYMMGPCRAYFKAQLHGEDVSLFCEKSGRMRFRGVDYAEKIFNSINLPLSWIQRSDESFRFGKCMAKIMCDATGICTEPELNMAVYTFVTDWNERELQKEAYANSVGAVYDPEIISEYNDLVQLIKDGRIDDPIVMPAVYEVPLWKVQHYLAQIGAGDLEAHIAMRVSEETERAQSGEWPQWAKGFALFIIGIVVLAIFLKVAGIF